MDKRTSSRGRGWRDPDKYLKPALALAFLLAALFTSNAWAQHHGGHHGFHHGHHGHAHFGLVIGAPLFYGPGWYGDPFYDPFYRPYYGPYAVQALAPPVYVERDVAPATSLWYFCNESQGYYPYVKQCPAGWRAVRPDSVLRP